MQETGQGQALAQAWGQARRSKRSLFSGPAESCPWRSKLTCARAESRLPFFVKSTRFPCWVDCGVKADGKRRVKRIATVRASFLPFGSSALSLVDFFVSSNSDGGTISRRAEKEPRWVLWREYTRSRTYIKYLRRRSASPRHQKARFPQRTC